MSTSIPNSTLDKFTTFGDLLRFLRRRAGITQLELSIAVGYSDAQISRLEQNLRLPDLPTIEARFIPALGLEDEPEVVLRLMDLAANVRREDAPGLGLCPYKGLSYFDETDVDLFVGREALTSKLIDNLLSQTATPEMTQARFMAIIGASGSGKSSLVRAGLVPAIRWNKAASNWLILVITPTSHPLESLAVSLTQDTGSMIAATSIMDEMARDSRSLNLFLKGAVKSVGSSHILLVIDQFEELFTLSRSEKERSAFIENLLTAASEPGGPAVVVITLRADFYAHCASYPKLREALASHQEYIGTMSDAEMRRAIEEPALRARWELEPGLVDLLLHDVGHEPGALPLLSHALLETWQRRRGRTMTMSGYAASGGVRSAISETAETVFADHFSPDQQAIARRIFIRLTELGDETSTGDTRRRATYRELILKPEEETITNTVLAKLADARLIITSEDSVEVAHEALIREWPKLRSWLEENRESLRLHRHLTEAVREWSAQNRDPDGLYRGARLIQAREWAATYADDMNTLEREFLDSSLAWADREASEREMQRKRELENAQKLAEVEKHRAEEQLIAAKLLRKRARYLAGAFGIALIMAFTALFFGALARNAATTALEQQRVSYARELAAAATSSLEVDPERSILLALQAVTATYDIDKTWTAEAENALRHALLASRVQHTLRGHTNRVWAVAFSPVCESNPSWSAQPCARRLATASDDGTVKVWDTATGTNMLTLPTNATRGFHGMAFSTDGRYLASAGESGTTILWDAISGQKINTLHGHTDWVSSVVFNPSGDYLATASEDRTAIIWNAVDGQKILTLTGHTAEVRDVAFDPSGKRLATASDDGKVKLWDAVTGEELLTLSGHENLPVNGVAFSPDGLYLATASGDRTVKLWDAATGKERITMRGHTDIVWKIAFSPEGTRLASAGFDEKVKVWDTATGQELFTLSGHTGPVVDLAYSPGCVSLPNALKDECGTSLATVSLDGTARLWNASFSKEYFTLFTPEVTVGAINSDLTRLAVGGRDGLLKIANISPADQAISRVTGIGVKGMKTQSITAASGPVWGVAFNADGTLVASTGADNRVRVWDQVTGTEKMSLPGRTGEGFPVTFNRDGSWLAAASNDYHVRLWNLNSTSDPTPREINTLVWSYSIAFSPDGERLATGGDNGTAVVWDVSSGEELLKLSRHDGGIWGIAYSPDGLRLATASEDRTVKVWDALTGQELRTLRGHSGAVNAVTFSPDGLSIATGSQDGTAKVWDNATGQERLTLYGHTDPIAGVSFSSDGKQLASASYNGMLRIYLLGIEDLMALARSRVTRTFTAEECQQYLHLTAEQCPQHSEQDIFPMIDEPDLITAQPGHSNGKICQVTDTAGVDDQFFNQVAYQGVKESAEVYGWQNTLLEPQTQAEYLDSIHTLLHSQCDLIVIPTGFSFIDAIRAIGEANPDQKFLILDSYVDPPLENLWVQQYATDQPSFLAGYLAASVTKTGKVGTYGGAPFPPVFDFMNGFALGVAYYNEMNGTHVEMLGWDVIQQEGFFTGNFVNTVDGRKMGIALMDAGADIIMPVAGNVGLGTAALVKERGDAYIIGVDSDWTITYPEYKSITLTSIEKRMDVSVLSAVRSINDGTFAGGNHRGTLESGDVGIAPFHDLDVLVSEKVRRDLEQIKADIISGKIKTSP